MNIIVDICAVVLLVISFMTGYGKGFLKTIASLVFIIIAAIIASFAAEALQDTAFEKFIYPSVKTRLSEYTAEICDSSATDSASINEKYDNYHSNLLTANEFSDIINTKAGEFTDSLKAYLETHELPFGIVISDESLGKLKTAIGDNVKNQAEDAVDSETDENPTHYSVSTTESGLNERLADLIITIPIRPMMVRLIGNVLFFIIFVVLSVVFGVIVNALGIINKIPLLGFVNRLAGGILGVLVAAALAFIILSILRFLITQGYIDTKTAFLDKSYAVRALDYLINRIRTV